jgi:hypothetical protein
MSVNSTRGEHPVGRWCTHRPGDERFDRVHVLIHTHEEPEVFTVVLEQRGAGDVRGQVAAVFERDSPVLAGVDHEGGDADDG